MTLCEKSPKRNQVRGAKRKKKEGGRVNKETCCDGDSISRHASGLDYLESVSLCTFVSPPPWVQGRAVQLQGMGWPRLRRPLQLQLPMAPPPPASSTAWPATCILFLSETVSSIARAIYPSYDYYCRSHHVRANPYSKLWIVRIAFRFHSSHRIIQFWQFCERITKKRGDFNNQMLNFDYFDYCDIYVFCYRRKRREGIIVIGYWILIILRMDYWMRAWFVAKEKGKYSNWVSEIICIYWLVGFPGTI